MGPNGSGKSTLAYAIAGHPAYDVTGGTINEGIPSGLIPAEVPPKDNETIC